MKKFLLTTCLVFAYFCSQGQYTPTDTLGYYSEYFKGRRQVKISLPSDYANSPHRRYRVVYLFDAQSTALFDFTKATLSFFPGYANFYFDPVIIVGIPSRNRHFEFLPKHVNTTPGPQNYQNAGGADTLAWSIEKEIKPLIEKKYRTNGFSIGVGHSLGGTFVTYAMLNYPNIFSAGICISPNYVFDNEAILSTLNKASKSGHLSGKFLYIGYGNGDETEDRFKNSSAKFGTELQARKLANFNFKVESLDNHSHSTTPIEGIFKGFIFVNDFMNLPYEKYKVFFTDKGTGNFIDFVKKYFETQKSKTGATLPTVGEANSIAYNAFYAGKKKEAAQVLEWALALYPDDANLHDSMGEIQEGLGDKEKAGRYYKSGIAVIESQKQQLSESTYRSKMDWLKKRLEKMEAR